MNAIVRTLRFVPPEEQHLARPAGYWRTLSPEERLRETLALHREGNDLFKRGSPGFRYIMEFRHVPAPR